MLDELLGRTPLKDRIGELETEAERLRERYEAESERRADAVTERQEAERRINRLEDRIAQLEGELDRASTDEAGEHPIEPRRRERLSGTRLEAVLRRLESFRTGPEGALTATVPDGNSVPDAVSDVLGDRARLLVDIAPCLVCADDAGVVSVALEPPFFPSTEPAWDDRLRIDRAAFLPTGRHLLALVRADLFAVGVYDGDERLTYSGFESEVKGSHSKGGFSQARFERIREGQIADHLDRCVESLDSIVAESNEPIDRLFLTGQEETVEELAASISREPTATATVDATGRPEEALYSARSSFFETPMTVL